jgi:hypothetical protein
MKLTSAPISPAWADWQNGKVMQISSSPTILLFMETPNIVYRK